MKYILFTAIVAAAVCLCLGQGDVQIVRYDNVQNPDGGYSFSFELSDGTQREEIGIARQAADGTTIIEVRGRFSYVADDGLRYTVDYVGDENGFQPTGDHLPSTEPPAALPPSAVLSLVG